MTFDRKGQVVNSSSFLPSLSLGQTFKVCCNWEKKAAALLRLMLFGEPECCLHNSLKKVHIKIASPRK